MQLTVDLTGRRVIVVGAVAATRRVLARYRAAGAVVERWEAEERVPLRVASAALLPASRPALLVWVEGPASLRAEASAEAARHGVWVVEEAAAATRAVGHVSIVGGGPGDAELMTLAARRALHEADVVLFDRLGPHEGLADWAPGAELIDVGKTPGHHAVPQHEIERLMVARALDGLDVVRLKGGDPFVFGRGSEEVRACRLAGVPFTIVPGVTSAISVPAAAGIPVTHREVSRAFTVVSGHAPFSEEELGHLAGLGGTLVVLMGVNTLPHLVAGLQRAGMAADMPLAIVERGWSHAQRTTISSVGGVMGLLPALAPRSPAVIVIGEVVRQTACDDASDPESIARAVDALTP
ncbi:MULTISPECIES: uroporphyrinogen-III C-methyltransferase [unclassified Rathayibacter]|uniref:uroporphyrinogen-III C-methyltransferase n=1 Tax=unclassified Rathayibacter TaxID=2609250 RepID=UPI00188DA38F|nr:MULTISPECIES: uroporphyrinogen-III C-methyltransferase [unclassified Rathayibacter]MBF4462935.1 uroporphyrinogen-III C-methyltransferase [Rathayibacter sp. VKM Ac-2879]MBF4504349.1 uroporphyrinogen-III C-methyltransferase [Rathayibacter sp. VKM Ac-2878]